MKFFTDRTSIENPSKEQVAQEIRSLALEDFAVLEIGNEIFIQTMHLEQGYLLEHRAGSADEHYEAIPLDGRARTLMPRPWWGFWMKQKSIFLFEGEEIIRAFCDYLDQKAAPEFVSWSKITI